MLPGLLGHCSFGLVVERFVVVVHHSLLQRRDHVVLVIPCIVSPEVLVCGAGFIRRVSEVLCRLVGYMLPVPSMINSQIFRGLMQAILLLYKGNNCWWNLLICIINTVTEVAYDKIGNGQ